MPRTVSMFSAFIALKTTILQQIRHLLSVSLSKLVSTEIDVRVAQWLERRRKGPYVAGLNTTVGCGCQFFG
jgi:hypothetical protein